MCDILLRKTVLSFLLLLILEGCSHTYILDSENKNIHIRKINYLSKTYTTLVQLNDGQQFYTNSMHIDNDTLFIQRYKLEAIPIELVSIIKLRDIKRGFFDGFFMGIPVSFVSMLITSATLNNCTEMCGLAMIAVGGLAYVTTVIVNTLFGGDKTFVFEKNIDNSFSRIK